MTSPADSLRSLADAARSRLDGGSCRVVVQVGHCSASVGAGELADAIRTAGPTAVDVVVAGCDGACHDAPKLTITHIDGTVTALTKVDAASAGRLAASMGRCRTDHPASSRPDRKPADDFFAGQTRVVLDGVGDVDPGSLDEYLLRGGYAGLAKALSSTPEAVTDQVKESGLRGRGGAYFPAAIKWESARKFTAPKYLVVNCEEGEPGIFKDRHIMEGMPHRLLEGAIIAAYASGAGSAYAYVNAEADLSAERLQTAIDQAYERGLLGDDILGSGFGLDVEIRRGAGGYVCGDETTLLNTMEGYRREPRIKPPLPIESGLWGKPTVINNAETLASVPFIVSRRGLGVHGHRRKRRRRYKDNQPQRRRSPARPGRSADGHDAARDHIRSRRRASKRRGVSRPSPSAGRRAECSPPRCSTPPSLPGRSTSPA